MAEQTAVIRKAGPEDVPAIAAIYNEIHDREEAGETTTGWLRDVYPTRQTAEDAVARGDMFVLELGSGRIVGTGIINRLQVDVYADGDWQFPAPDDEVMVLHTLVISKEGERLSGRKGLGSMFLAYYEAFALENGCPFLRLDTNARNAAARAFYRKHGYTEIGVVPTVFNGIPGVDLVLIEKNLERQALKRLFPEIPYLEGGGITLKAVAPEDADGLRQLVASPAVQKHLPTFLFEQKYGDMDYVIRHLYDECLEESLILGIYRDGAFCGLAEMYGYNEKIRKISVGCRILEQYWGQGVVAEALRLMTDYLYGQKGIEIITASTMVVNKPAAGVLRKSGFDLVVHSVEEDWGYPEPTLADKWIR